MNIIHMANVMFADTYKGEIRMKRILIQLDYNNVDDIPNDMIAELLEAEVSDIEGVTAATVADIKDYNTYITDLENRSSHYNYGYEE
jgi:hypothetical protein